MPFDPNTAKPLPGGFDPSSAKPTTPEDRAAFGIYPRQRATPSTPETKAGAAKAAEAVGTVMGFDIPEEPEFSPERIATSGAVGAGMGAFGPQALKGAGTLVGMIPTPPTRAAGGLMKALGTGLQRIPPAKRTAGTAALTAGAEAGGQAAQQVGLPRIVGELGVGAAAPRLGRMATEAVLGRPTFTSERAARRLEELGFELSPSQVRERKPIGEYGQMFKGKKNQDLANRLASKGTGKEAREINEKFLQSRIDDLGGQYDKLYKGQTFRVDPSVQNSLQSLLDYEQSLGVAGVSTVKQAADTIINKLRTGGPQIVGDDLQRLRNAVTQRARDSNNPSARHEMYNFVRQIDDAISQNNPMFKATLDKLNPQYRNTMILKDLLESGGIQQGNISLERLGNLMRAQAMRRSPQDIDELAQLGRTAKLRALWEPAGQASAAESALGQVFGTTADIAAALAGTRGATARDVQRSMLTTKPTSPRVTVPAAVAAREATGALPQPTEE